MESFFHTLKTERVHHRVYVTRDQAGRQITKFGGDIMGFMAPFMTGATVGRILRNPNGGSN